MNKILAFIEAAKSLGISAVSCVVKGILVGFVLALVLTLALFYWGESLWGMKYIFGFIFFIASGLLLSLWRVLKGELALVDSAVDSTVVGITDMANGLLGNNRDLLNSEIQFDNAKNFLSGKCPAVAPLLNAVSYNQFMSLVQKSKHVSQASAFVGNKVDKISDTPNMIADMVGALKLVWQIPVGTFMKKILIVVAVASVAILAIRLLM